VDHKRVIFKYYKPYSDQKLRDDDDELVNNHSKMKICHYASGHYMLSFYEKAESF